VLKPNPAPGILPAEMAAPDAQTGMAPAMTAMGSAAEAKGGVHPAWAALAAHWPEYGMEAAGLGLFMTSACLFTTLLEHPASPVHQAISNPLLRRVPMGLAMGLTFIAIVYSPWGKRSGAHLNPAVTLTFFRLKKVAGWDAFFYAVSQFAGGAAGVFLAAALLGERISHQAVNYAATLPLAGPGPAFLAEVVITFFMMSMVLAVTNTARLARFTGLFAGLMVAAYIILEAPISGMSMNPARSLASALPPQMWSSLWIYFTAPLLGMLLAAETYVRARGAHHVYCAKLHHHNRQRCIFHCRFRELLEQR